MSLRVFVDSRRERMAGVRRRSANGRTSRWRIAVRSRLLWRHVQGSTRQRPSLDDRDIGRLSTISEGWLCFERAPSGGGCRRFPAIGVGAQTRRWRTTAAVRGPRVRYTRISRAIRAARLKQTAPRYSAALSSIDTRSRTARPMRLPARLAIW